MSESQIKICLVEQYYCMQRLLMMTNNLEKRIDWYERIGFDSFQKLTIVGSLQVIEDDLVIDGKNYYVPIVKTMGQSVQGISPVLFPPSVRKLLISQHNYHNNKLFVPFSKIIQLSKKNRQLVMAFTHLKPQFYQENLYFRMTPQSYILQLSSSYYNTIIRAIQAIPQFHHSRLDLTQVLGQNQMDENIGCRLQHIKNRLQEKSDNPPVIGKIYQIQHQSQIQNNYQDKNFQVILKIVQDNFSPNFQEIGVSQVIIKYSDIQNRNIINSIKEGYVYLFINPQIIITNTVGILYLCNLNNMFKLSSNQIYSHPQQFYTSIQPSLIGHLQKKSIYRNIMKFKVTLIETEMLYCRIICSKCKNIMNGQKCRQCENINFELDLWLQAIVCDKSGMAQITMNTREIINFYELKEDTLQKLMKEIKIQAQLGSKGITIYHHKKNKIFNNKIFQYVQAILCYNFIEKQVIGVCKCNLNKTFQQLPEQNKQQFQIGYNTTKQYLKKQIRINLNGRIIKYHKKLLPYIKIYQICV